MGACMRKNRMKKILVMCVIINILFCAEVESVLAYPAQCSISVTRREQQETNWCWAAVSQMIGAHYYGLLTQRQIVINVLGAEYNQGASDAQVRQAIAFAINNKYNVTTRNSLSYEKIQKYISTSKLMGIKMVWNSGGAHALVLSGYSADGKVISVHNSKYIDSVYVDSEIELQQYFKKSSESKKRVGLTNSFFMPRPRA